MEPLRGIPTSCSIILGPAPQEENSQRLNKEQHYLTSKYHCLVPSKTVDRLQKEKKVILKKVWVGERFLLGVSLYMAVNQMTSIYANS